MKKEMNPAVMVAVVVAVVAVIGFFIWRGTSGGGASTPAGGVGNASPFAPGGSQVGNPGRPSGARPPAGAGVAPGGPPGR